MRHLAECPADFLAEPRIGTTGVVAVDAVVSDLLHLFGSEPLNTERTQFFRAAAVDARQQRNQLQLTLIGCWLFHETWFRQTSPDAQAIYQFLTEGVRELASTTPAQKYITDAERREEFIRCGLQALSLRPAGETMAQAQDRLTTLSTNERMRVLRAARAAEERAHAIREAMRRKAAEEANAKAMRE
jgi:alpha-galactosidase/6-phospho-beta-glucosidase family protein